MSFLADKQTASKTGNMQGEDSAGKKSRAWREIGVSGILERVARKVLTGKRTFEERPEEGGAFWADGTTNTKSLR